MYVEEVENLQRLASCLIRAPRFRIYQIPGEPSTLHQLLPGITPQPKSNVKWLCSLIANDATLEQLVPFGYCG